MYGPRDLNVDDDEELLRRINLPRMFEREVGALHGMAAGIIYDGEVDDSEIAMLTEWVERNREFADVWPISELREVLLEILEDNVVTGQERRRLYGVLDRIAASNEKAGTASPSLCEVDPAISFRGRSFLVTGRLRTGTRRKAEEKIQERGGVVAKSPRKDLDYLVIGELGTEMWAHSRYGRKIEKVMQNRESGSETSIVSEKDFVHALIGT